jgi:hypothetical protein
VYQPGFFVFEHLQGDHLLALAAAAFADNMSVFFLQPPTPWL